MIYLASPYSHPDADVRRDRFEAACRVAAGMMRAGDLVFSPIAHSHPIAVHGGLPLDWEFWKPWDRWALAHCDRFAILTLDGWQESRGVTAERQAWGLYHPEGYVEHVAP